VEVPQAAVVVEEEAAEPARQVQVQPEPQAQQLRVAAQRAVVR
jgi:hypothetical protein